MDKMDFYLVGRKLREKGYMAVNVNEMATPRGIAASWDVLFDQNLIASCYDSGDGACVSVDWEDQSHKDLFAEAGKVINQYEPVETAMAALSLIAG